MADLEAQIEAVTEMREAVGACVAALVADGFTDEQARIITTGLFANMSKGKPDDG